MNKSGAMSKWGKTLSECDHVDEIIMISIRHILYSLWFFFLANTVMSLLQEINTYIYVLWNKFFFVFVIHFPCYFLNLDADNVDKVHNSQHSSDHSGVWTSHLLGY